MSDTKRKLAAIVFTDIVGFTKLTAKNQSKASSLLKKQRELFRPIIESFNGEWIKEMGDGLLLTFDTVTDAVNCCIKLQDTSKKIDDLVLRIGIHQGEILVEDNDIIGDDVNVAARIEPFSAPGGIAISSKVHDAIIREEEFETKYLGKPKLKGVGQKVEVYCLTSHDLTETILSDVSAKLEPEGYQWNFYSLSGAAFTIIGILFWINLSFIGIGVADTNEVLSLAVLPFENKGDKKDDFYAYGISSDLIKDVSSAGMLRVAGLGDIEKLEYSEMNYNKLADKLRVRYVAKGTLWKMDSVFQLSMELFDTKNSEVVWSNRWQTNWSDLATIKGDLSNEILANLNIMVTKNTEQVNVAGNPEAYEYYLKGKYKLKKRTTLEDIEISRGMFEKAMNLDSNLTAAVNSLAASFSLTSDLDKSEELYNRAFKISLRLNDKLAQLRALNGLGILEYTKGNLDESLEKFLQVKTIAEEMNSKAQYASSLNNLSIIYYARGNLDRGLEMLHERCDIAESLDDKYGMQYAYGNLGLYYAEKGENKLGLEYTLKAYELAKENEDLSSQANILTNIAYHELYINKDYDESLRGFNEVLGIYDRLGEKHSAIRTHHHIIDVYAAMHKYTEMLETSEQALKLSKETKIDPLIATSYTTLAWAHNELGNRSEGLKNLNHARKISEKGNNQDMLGHVLGLFSDYFQDNGNLDSSMHYATNALTIHEALGNKLNSINNIYDIARIYLQEGKTELAMNHVEKAMAIAKETKDDMALHQLYGLKGFIYFQQKNYAQAMDGNLSEWYNWYTDNKTDIFVISSIESMSTYLLCLKKLNRDYDLSQLEKLMKEKPERKYGYVTNYRLYQIYEENTFLKNAYDEIIKVKSNLDKRTGDKFINYPLESEIVKVYRSIS